METDQRPPLDSHALIQEYRQVLQHPDYEPHSNTDAVVVLSGRYDKDAAGNVTREDTEENIARIAFGIESVRRIAAMRTGKPIETASFIDGPPLVLNGETEQLPMMERVALNLGVPREAMELVDCGRRGVGNTRTQFEVMQQDERFANARNLLFITSGYHVPRVERTAERQLPEQDTYQVIAPPYGYQGHRFNIFTIRGEIRRILAYSQKGDIATFPIRAR
jgi:uncharacterized SAM-binding protein YcdF (DUF218 family)